MIIVLLFVLLALFYSMPKGSLARIFTFLYLISLCTNFFIGTDLQIGGLSDVLYVVWTSIVLIMVISPWKKTFQIDSIICTNEKGLTRFVYIVGALCVFMTIGCSIIAYFVSKGVDNINVFKYGGGQEEVYASLGISMKPYLLAYLFYPVSYLFIPLIFFYLSRKQYTLSFWCLLCSLTSVFFGLAYFSRSHTTQYVMLLAISYWVFSNALSAKIRKWTTLFFAIVALTITVSFAIISFSRFDGYGYGNQKSEAIIKNTVAYSLADYFGMWYYVGKEATSYYHFEGFDGRIAFQGIDRFLNMVSFGVIPSYSSSLSKQREVLLREHSGGFIGISTYFLYDTGVLISLLILFLYKKRVIKISSHGKEFNIINAMELIILMTLPLFGIFYSFLDIIILTLFYWYFLKRFLIK